MADDEDRDQPTPAEETAASPPTDTTAEFTAVVDEAPRWTARARVPPPSFTPEVDEAEVWAAEPEPRRRGVGVPLVYALCALVLVGLIGVGVGLMVRGNPVTPVPVPVPTTVASSATGVATATRSATVTTAPASSAPSVTTTAPATVTVPDVRDLTPVRAAQRLRALGLVPVRRLRSSDEVPPGQIIGTDPAAGSVVLRGSDVTIIVSSGALLASTAATPEPSATS